jgi:hypothetical protein
MVVPSPVVDNKQWSTPACIGERKPESGVLVCVGLAEFLFEILVWCGIAFGEGASGAWCAWTPVGVLGHASALEGCWWRCAYHLSSEHSFRCGGVRMLHVECRGCNGRTVCTATRLSLVRATAS